MQKERERERVTAVSCVVWFPFPIPPNNAFKTIMSLPAMKKENALGDTPCACLLNYSLIHTPHKMTDKKNMLPKAYSAQGAAPR